MEIEEKAKRYAEGKAISAITAAIEKAYIDGYKSGYRDGVTKRVPPKEFIDGVEYVDLGLPSGTRWSSTILLDENRWPMYLPYDKASKLNIPTADQFNELIHHCNTHAHEYINIGNNVIDIIKKGSEDTFFKGLVFWLKGSTDSISEGLCANNNKVSKIYKGCELPIMLVH